MPPVFPDGSLLPASVRDQLVAIGLPRSQHSFDALVAMFPRDFNVSALSLSTEDLARVLIRLVETKIISIADTSGPICVRQVRPGWHECRFYRNFHQLLDLIAPYIAEGLSNGEGCLWVLPESVGKQTACAALTEFTQNVDSYLTSGQLEILSHREWYLDSDGRLKSFEQIAAALLEKQDQVLAKGYKFLRAAGDTGWVSGTEESKAFIDYEMKVNDALGSTQVAAVCTYRADVTADELVAIITAHQDALGKAAATG